MNKQPDKSKMVMSWTIRGVALSLAFATLLLGACNGGEDNGGGGSPPPADTTPPTVNSTTPADNATDVAVSANINAIFSEALDCATLTAATFTVSAGGAVAGTVTCSGSSATFTPSASLSASTAYTATVTTGVRDLAGNALAADYAFSFTTAPPPDTTPPTVTTTTPAGDAVNVALNAVVTVNFSEAMDCATLTNASFTLASGGAVAGNVTCNGPSATFTPTASLAAGTAYTATVTTGARDVAGNALAANRVWSFATGNIKAWGTPTLLETAAGAAGGPAVAADRQTNGGSGDGTAIAVWSQDNSIYTSRYTGSWSARQLIGNDVSGGGLSAYGPRIAMGDYGQAIVLWGLSNTNVWPPNYSIWSNRYGGTWGTAEQISPVGGGNANSPQLSFDTSNYNVFTVWSQYLYGSSRYNYRATQRPYYYVPCPDLADLGCAWNPADFGWRSTSMLGQHDIGDVGEPQVAAWGTRNAVAVWTQNIIGGVNQIWAQVATNGDWGALTTAVRVNTGSIYDATAPMVAVDNNGNAFAVWFEWAPGRKTLYASRYTASTATWSAPVQVDDPTGDNASHYDPPRHAVVMDANGNALLVWQQANAGRVEYNIYARRCPGAVPSNCSAPVLLENSTGYADFPALALAPNGDAIAVWKQEDGAARRIYANHYSASSNSWNANPSLVGGANSTWNEGPQIAIDGNGNATVVWTEYESGQYNIYANRFE